MTLRLRLIENNILTYLTFLLVAIVYYFTTARSVMEMDCAHLIASQYFFGVAHPTGYPLYSLLGWLFLRIPLSYNIAFQANLLSGLYSIIALAFIFKTLKIISEFFFESQDNNKLSNQNYRLFINIARLVSVAALAFSKNYWRNSLSAEVYTLQVAITSAIIFYAIDYFFDNNVKKNDKKLFIISILVGLGFANHLMTALIVPALLYVYFIKSNVESIKKRLLDLIYYVFTAFFIVSIFYLIMSLRANQDPVINWGAPKNLRRLIEHITAKQFASEFEFNLIFFTNNLYDYIMASFNDYGIIIFIISLYGFFIFKKIETKLFYFLILILLPSIVVPSFYNVIDRENYYLIAGIGWTLSFFISVVYIFRKINFLKKCSLILFLFPALNAICFYKQNDLSRFDLYEKIYKISVESLPFKSVVLIDGYDHIIYPYNYYAYVEGIRKDIVFISMQLLKTDWYYENLQSVYPEAYKIIRDEADSARTLIINKRLTDISVADLYRKIIVRLKENNFYIFATLEATNTLKSILNKEKFRKSSLLYEISDTLIERAPTCEISKIDIAKYERMRFEHYSLSYAINYIKAFADKENYP